MRDACEYEHLLREYLHTSVVVFVRNDFIIYVCTYYIITTPVALISLFNCCFLFCYSSTSKIIVSNLAPHIRFEDIEHLLTQHGHVVACDKLTSKDPNTQTVQISFENSDQAQQWVLKHFFFVKYYERIAVILFENIWYIN